MVSEIIKSIIAVVGLAVVVKVIKDIFNDKQYEPRVVGNAKYVSTRDTILIQYLFVFMATLLFAASLFFCYDWFYDSKFKYDPAIAIGLIVFGFIIIFINSKSNYVNIAVINNSILISGIVNKYEVSFKNIDKIVNTTFTPPNRLTIYFKNKTKFGTSVNFFPVNTTIEGELLTLLKKSQNDVD